MKKILINALIFASAIGILLAALNFQALQDWYELRYYTPSNEVAALANDSGMSEEGRRLFYLADPAINQKDDFNNNCPFPEKTIVLGCFNGTNIYLLEIRDNQLNGVMEVTAAHEMLHHAYQRLSEADKQQVKSMIDTQVAQLDHGRLQELVSEYKEEDTETQYNELHSIFATELASVTSELETYYARFFNDRAKVTKASQQYEKVFTDIEDDIAVIDTKLTNLKTKIDSTESELDNLSNQIDTERAQIDQLFEDENFSEYNARVPGFNVLVNSYNSKVNKVRSLVVEYNSLVRERNQKALQQNELVNSINSKFEPLAQ